MSSNKGKTAKKTIAINVTFESIVRSECRNWWENVEDNHPLKEVLGRAEVDKIIFIPSFNSNSNNLLLG